jgi:hypothetical protein
VLINKNNLKLLSFMRIFQFLVLTTNYMYHSKLQERRGLSLFVAPGFEPSCARLSPPRCLTYPLGLQDVQWAVRLVVVRASWPGHPRKKKKIKKKRSKDLFVTQLNNFNIYNCNIELNLLSLLSKKFIIYHSFYIFLICTH